MKAWQVALGAGWSRFAQPAGDAEFFGTAQRDAQIGALGLRSDGRFVLVNGQQSIELNSFQVVRALRRTPGGDRLAARSAALRRAGSRNGPTVLAAAEPEVVMGVPNAATVVVVKKRRRVPNAGA